MADFSAYGWHWNIRGKGQVNLLFAQGRSLGQFREQLRQHGQLVVEHKVYVTAQRYGPVSIAAVMPFGHKDPWLIVSDEPCSARTFAEYHQRTQIEEGFLDLKSATFNLEDTRLGQAQQLLQLLWVMGLAYVMLLIEGTALVAAQERRTVDPHWHRGLSYAQLGCRAVRRALTERKPLLERLRLSPNPDPEPSRRRCSPLRWHLIQGFS